MEYMESRMQDRIEGGLSENARLHGELQQRDARIAELENALHALITAHNGYRYSFGPCLCAAHEDARKVLGISRDDETPQSLMVSAT